MPTVWPSTLPDPAPVDATGEHDLQVRAWQPEAGPPKVRRVSGARVTRRSFRVVVDGSGLDTLLAFLEAVAASDMAMELPAPEADGVQTWTLDAAPVRTRLLRGGPAHASRLFEAVFGAWRQD